MPSWIQRATSMVILPAALATSALPAQSLDTLRSALLQRIPRDTAVTVGLYFRDLASRDSITINADTRFHAASTMKVPVLIQAFRDIDANRLSLRGRLRVTNDFHSLADSSVFHLSETDDSDSSLYRKVGQEVALNDLLELMITKSSNLATNIVIDTVRAARVQATLHEIGADSVRVLRGVEDNAAFQRGMNNTTTARGLGRVMSAIVDGTAASAQACGEMLDILKGQRFNDGIPAGLPRHTPVAHKTGWITGQHHDAAIVYRGGRPRYVLVIMTRGIAQQAQSAALMADLTRIIDTTLFPPPPPPQSRRMPRP